MTIKQKLLSAGLALSLMIAILLVVSIYSFGNLGKGFVQIIEKSEVGVANSEKSKSNISKVNTLLRNVK